MTCRRRANSKTAKCGARRFGGCSGVRPVAVPAKSQSKLVVAYRRRFGVVRERRGRAASGSWSNRLGAWFSFAPSIVSMRIFVRAAGGGEAAGLAAGRQDAVAGNDDREWVGAQSLADGAGGARRVEFFGDLAIGQYLAGRDGAGDVVDAAVEVRDAVQVELGVPEGRASRLASAPRCRRWRDCTSAGGADSARFGEAFAHAGADLLRRSWSGS